MKGETKSTKPQKPNPRETPIIKLQNSDSRRAFLRILNLGFAWDLGFGI